MSARDEKAAKSSGWETERREAKAARGVLEFLQSAPKSLDAETAKSSRSCGFRETGGGDKGKSCREPFGAMGFKREALGAADGVETFVGGEGHRLCY